MPNLIAKFRKSEFYYLFNSKDELAVGRQAMYLYNILITVTNSIITGVLYTAFLTVNGIDIVNVSIITFIPYIAWCVSVFTPYIYSRVKRRRGLLLFNTTFYYTCIILATTVMPSFVTSPGARTAWFAVLLLAGNISNALLGSGSTAWHIHYISDERSRTGYLSYTNIAITSVTTLVSISAALLTDSLKDSPLQATIINGMRYTAYVLALCATFYLWLRPAREFPYPPPKRNFNFLDVFRIPFENKAFMYTFIVFFLYNFVANVNAGSWNYYVMNTLRYKLIFMFTAQTTYSIAYMIMLSKWRNAVTKHGYLKIYLFTILVAGVLEFPMGFTRSSTVWLYLINNAIQGINLVGTSYINSNLFYINLPEGKTDNCIVFWNLGTNLFALLGSLSGTAFISFTEKTGPYILNFNLLGFEVRDYILYGSQLLVFIKGMLYFIMAAFIVLAMRKIKAIKEAERLRLAEYELSDIK